MIIAWLPGAIIDLQRLREFLLPLDKAAARKAVVAVQGAVQLLHSHPFLGRPVSDMPDYRDVIIPFGSAGYVLRYRIQADAVLIVALKHTKEAGFSSEQ
jgi:plasmid stabilization system protein ParE